LPARTTRDGVYILNSALQDITNQGANAYNGAVAWGSTSSSSPMRLSVGEDGNVYICDWSDAHPGVWVMNPERPADSFVPVFNGLTKASSGLSSFNGVDVHGSIAHCYSTGTGDETKLFTFDEDYVNAEASSAGNLLQYNIGKLTAPYQAAPIVVYNDALNGNLQQNMNSCIAPDARGGWWISQYRSADASTIPSLIHVNTAGLVDFNSGLTPTLVENSNHGGMAVSADGTKLAMGCANEIKIFSVAYNTAGVPVLTRLHSIKPALGASTAGLSFDRAGNVYAVSFSDKRMGVWAIMLAVQEIFKDKWRLLRKGKGHIVIVGAGSKGKTLGIDWIKNTKDLEHEDYGKLVVFIEKDKNNSNVDILKDEGAIFVFGDGSIIGAGIYTIIGAAAAVAHENLW
jgi:hypothetical protein